MFHFIIFFFRNYLGMCATKTVPVSLSLIFLVAASFCIYQAHAENKVGHHSQINCQGLCENGCQKFRVNGGECYYLVDESMVDCNFSWLYGGNRCEENMWWD